MEIIVNFWNSFTRMIVNFFTGLGVIIQGFTIKDAIDILIVTFILFGIIKLIRATRAAQLVKGIVIIALIFLTATQLELFVTSTLLRYFFQLSWIAILIVFQPEIRSALEKMGRSQVRKRFRMLGIAGERLDEEKLMRRCIVVVANTAAVFQQEKTGALIVFEREIKLGEAIETGTIIDAEPSEAMIGNIFFNKAPLHDGAMIIRDAKIYAAGCILPLTNKEENISSDLGTRHRAALGMSENSDAVIVVVSEETGQISIAMDGVLTRDYTRESLISELENLLIEQKGNNGENRLLVMKRRSK